MFRTRRSTPTPASLAGPAAAIAILTLAIGYSCSPERKDKFMRTFFDGYPSESQAKPQAPHMHAPKTRKAKRPEPLPQIAGWSDTISETHADFAEDCDSCHSPTKTVTPAMCMECHEDIEIHGDATPGAFAHCGTCHREHRGRDAELINVD